MEFLRNRRSQAAIGVLVVAVLLLVLYFMLGRGTHAQPSIKVAFAADGQGLKADSLFAAGGSLQARFSSPMDKGSVAFSANNAHLASPSWNSDATVATVQLPQAQPGSTVTVSVTGKGASGASIADGTSLRLTAVALEPANTANARSSAYRPTDPVEITIEDLPDSKPQSGLQQADIVFEYLSEYGISRMTAIYFDKLPATNIGPVRSCRPINLFLPFAYTGVGLCSGASSGTEHLLFQKPFTPVLQDPFAPKYFFRTNNKPAPHNLYTNGGLAASARHQWPLPTAAYFVDSVHTDSNAGSPTGAPSVPLHHVTYSYDAGSRMYLRSDRGQPFIDVSTGKQLSVKNVVIITVGYRILGYVEDDYGGAHSVWYDMSGSGPAQVYADGRMQSVTWHLCPGASTWSKCTSPIYFTDAKGNVVRLDSGLTWIHVVGKNQDPNS